MGPKKKKRSSTLSFLYVWLLMLPVMVLVQTFVSTLPPTAPGYGLVLPLALFVQFTGLGSLAYLGLEYTSQFIENRKLPSGSGEVKNLKRYQLLSSVWMAYLLLAILTSLFVRIVPPLPLTELTTYAGIIMVAYVGGQKSAKLSVTLGPDFAQYQPTGPLPRPADPAPSPEAPPPNPDPTQPQPTTPAPSADQGR